MIRWIFSHDVAGRLGRNVAIVHDFWQQWTRKGTASTTVREDRRFRRVAVGHRTASVAEIRPAFGTTMTEQTVTNWLHQEKLSAKTPCRVHSTDSKPL